MICWAHNERFAKYVNEDKKYTAILELNAFLARS